MGGTLAHAASASTKMAIRTSTDELYRALSTAPTPTSTWATTTGHTAFASTASVSSPLVERVVQNSDGCASCPTGHQEAQGIANLVHRRYGSFRTSLASPPASRVPGIRPGITGAASCNQCSAGTFASSRGTRNCQACPEGRYQDANGQSSCKDCKRGTFTLLPAPAAAATVLLDIKVDRTGPVQSVRSWSVHNEHKIDILCQLCPGKEGQRHSHV